MARCKACNDTIITRDPDLCTTCAKESNIARYEFYDTPLLSDRYEEPTQEVETIILTGSLSQEELPDCL